MSKKVLIVEDEPNIAESLSFLLGQAGFEVTIRGDGAAGLEAVRASLPDLVVLDVMLPTLDGYRVLEALRADRATSSLPVIVLTAKGQREDREAALSHGADRVMTKPYANADIVAAVRELAGA